MSIFYFAYGSNMLPTRLAARCPSAKLIGRADAPGYRVRFAKHGMDGSAKATLVVAEGAASGVLFALDPKDLAALDRAEGVGRGYDRLDDFRVRHDGQSLDTVTYIAPNPVQGLAAFDWYLALVLAGAQLHRFDKASMAEFRAVRWQADPVPDRPGRVAALAALAAHGIADPVAFLQQDDGPV